MRLDKLFIRCALLPLTLVSMATTSHAQVPEVVDTVKLSDLVLDIERAIAEARVVHPEEPYFIIREIELNMSGTWNSEGKFEIPVWIFTGAGEASKVETEDFAMVLEPPPDGGLVGGQDFVDITALLKTLKETFENTSLRAKSIEFTRKWMLELGGEAEANLAIMKIGGGISEEQAQGITFRLCQTEDLETCVAQE